MRTKLTKDRPIGLILIVVYKVVVTVIFSMAAIILKITASADSDLQQLASEFKLAGHHQIIEWILEKILKFDPKRLDFFSAASGFYAIVTSIEAIGLWQRKIWAHWLVIALVASGIFPEVYEISHGITFLKAIILFLNIVMLWYLITDRPHHH